MQEDSLLTDRGCPARRTSSGLFEGQPAKWLLSGSIVLLLMAGGYALDRQSRPDLKQLFIGFSLASVSGVIFTFLAITYRIPQGTGRWFAVAAAYGVWRISYFPIMVFAGHLSSIGESLLLLIGLPVFIFPIFLISMSLLHAFTAGLGWWAFQNRRKWGIAIPGFSFLIACFISFSTREDFHPLPDRAYSYKSEDVRIRLPEANPYFPALQQHSYSITQSVLVVAAGLTYGLIPESPWARVVKGVLEESFSRSPVASTADRTKEHYYAYQCAHRYMDED